MLPVDLLVLVLSTASPTFTHIADTLVTAVLIPTFLILSFLFEIPPSLFHHDTVVFATALNGCSNIAR